MSTCLGPYLIQSSGLPETENFSLVDHLKTFRIMTTSSDSPQDDAILLFNESEKYFWECPSQLGRKYTFMISACEVFITDFENGFLHNNQYGISSFCFGKIYTEDSVVNSSNRCQVIFDFDNRTFKVTAEESEDFGLFNCGRCAPPEKSSFQKSTIGFGDPDDPDIRTLPIAPPPTKERVNVVTESDANIAYLPPSVHQITPEERVKWDMSWEETLGDIRCQNQETLLGTPDLPTDISSTDNPNVARLPDGRSVVAFEKRDEETGDIVISVVLIHSSVDKKIIYHRDSSGGKLVNGTSDTFEIFEDIVVDVEPNIQIGFLTGPLKGLSPFNITSIERSELDPGPGPRVKYTIKFDPGNRVAFYDDSNDINDVKWFICDSISTSPQEILDITPQSLPGGATTQVAHPSVAAATNNKMIGSGQHIFVSYQAFVDNQWNIYVKHLILTDKTPVDPRYKEPYVPQSPVLSETQLSTSGQVDIVYKVVQISNDVDQYCAVFDVFLIDGRQVKNCDGNETDIVAGACGLTADDVNAHVFVTYFKNQCVEPPPDWEAGDTFIGAFPATPTILGWNGQNISGETTTFTQSPSLIDVSDDLNTPLVNELFIFNSELHILGDFESADSVSSTENGFKWDEVTVTAISSGSEIGLPGLRAVVIGNTIYAIRSNGSASSNSGSGWSQFFGANAIDIAVYQNDIYLATGTVLQGTAATTTSFPGNSATILGTDGSNLYAAGSTGVASAEYDIYSYNGSTWTQIGVADDTVTRMIAYDDGGGTKLIVGGQFNNIRSVDSSSISSSLTVAQWDGTTWSSVGFGPGITITDFAVNSTTLYAAGQDSDGTYSLWSFSNNIWQKIDDALPLISAIEFFANSLYIGFGEPNSDDELVISYEPTTQTINTCFDIEHTPSITNWCFFEADCNQTSIFEDTICPSPYISMIYFPEDLYMLELENEQKVTRVLYHMGTFLTDQTVQLETTITTTEPLDFMFVVDGSSSMVDLGVETIKANIIDIAQKINNDCSDAQFGLVLSGGAASTTHFGSEIGTNNSVYSMVENGFTDLSGLTSIINNQLEFRGSIDIMYGGIEFALSNSYFQWRTNSKRVICVISDLQFLNDSPSDTSDDATVFNSMNGAKDQIQIYAAGVRLIYAGDGQGGLTDLAEILSVASPSFGLRNINDTDWSFTACNQATTSSVSTSSFETSSVSTSATDINVTKSDNTFMMSRSLFTKSASSRKLLRGCRQTIDVRLTVRPNLTVTGGQGPWPVDASLSFSGETSFPEVDFSLPRSVEVQVLTSNFPVTEDIQVLVEFNNAGQNANFSIFPDWKWSITIDQQSPTGDLIRGTIEATPAFNNIFMAAPFEPFLPGTTTPIDPLDLGAVAVGSTSNVRFDITTTCPSSGIKLGGNDFVTITSPDPAVTFSPNHITYFVNLFRPNPYQFLVTWEPTTIGPLDITVHLGNSSKPIRIIGNAVASTLPEFICTVQDEDGDPLPTNPVSGNPIIDMGTVDPFAVTQICIPIMFSGRGGQGKDHIQNIGVSGHGSFSIFGGRCPQTSGVRRTSLLVPGNGEVTLGAIWSPDGSEGLLQASINLTTHSPVTAPSGLCNIIDLQVNSVSSPDCLISGNATHSFGAVEINTTVSITFTITNIGGGTLSGDVEFDGSAGDFSLVFSSVSTFNLSHNESFTFDVEYTPTVIDASLVTVHITTNSADCRDITISGKGVSSAVCQITPASVDFGEVLLENMPQEQSVTIRNITSLGGDNLSLLVTLQSCSGISIRDVTLPYAITIAPQDEITLDLEFNVSQMGTFDCILDLGDDNCPSVPVRGVANETPHCVISDSSIDFGDVQIGKSITTTVFIENAGGGTLQGHLSLTDTTNFSISIDHYSLEQNQSVSVDITCSPVSEGELSVILRVGTLCLGTNSDGTGSSAGDISLVARAVKLLQIGTVIERDTSGFEPTFLNKAEILVTYEGDLSDLWTQRRDRFQFVDNALSLSGQTKGLSNLPFDLEYSSIYGVDPVHIRGNPANWVYFDGLGALDLDHSQVGTPSEQESVPVLISEKSIRPKVIVNNRNDVIVAYESYRQGSHQIEIKGTGDFAQSSITGPKAKRQTRLIQTSDFTYVHSITIAGEGLNQLCDLIVDNNDVTHITWQSNRDKFWEIYYANGLDLFSPVRVSQAESRSGFPSIDVDNNGNIFIVYHDNRFGPYQIMLAYKNERRILPLIEQDAYLASFRESYLHHTNTLPITVTNSLTEQIVGNILWAVKNTDSSGNGDTNFIFVVDPLTGATSLAEQTIQKFAAIAGDANGVMYSITTEGVVFRVSTTATTPIRSSDFLQLGTLEGINPEGAEDFVSSSSEAEVSPIESTNAFQASSTSTSPVVYKAQTSSQTCGLTNIIEGRCPIYTEVTQSTTDEFFWRFFPRVSGTVEWNVGPEPFFIKDNNTTREVPRWQFLSAGEMRGSGRPVGPYNGTMSATLNKQSFEVPIRGFVVNAPPIPKWTAEGDSSSGTALTEYDFGDVQVGEEVVIVFRLHNTGSAIPGMRWSQGLTTTFSPQSTFPGNSNVSGITAGGAGDNGFSVLAQDENDSTDLWPGFYIPAGESQKIRVRFKPDGDGEVTKKLTASGAAGTQTVLTLTATGIGGPSLFVNAGQVNRTVVEGNNITETDQMILRNDGGSNMTLAVSPLTGAQNIVTIAGVTLGEFFSLAPGASRTITCSYTTSTLSPAVYLTTVSVIPIGADTRSFDIQITVNDSTGMFDTSLVSNPYEVESNAGGSTPTLTISIGNIGDDSISYSATAEKTWVNLSKSSGSITTASTDTIQITFNEQPEGLHTSYVKVEDSTAVNSPVFYQIEWTVNDINPVINVDPTTVDRSFISGQTISELDCFVVTNTGGGDLTYTISETITWLHVLDAPEILSRHQEKVHDVRYEPNVSGLSIGTHTGIITVTGSGLTPITVTVNLTVVASTASVIGLDKPVLLPSVIPGNNAENHIFDIYQDNSSAGTLTWTIDDSAKPSWVSSISPLSGSSTGPTNKTSVTITFDTSSLASGAYAYNFTVTGGSVTRDVYVHLRVHFLFEEPFMSMSPLNTTKQVIEGQNLDDMPITVANVGKGVFNYRLRSQESWITLDTTGSIIGQSTAKHIATFNTSGLGIGKHVATIYLEDNNSPTLPRPTLFTPQLTLNVVSDTTTIIGVNTNGIYVSAKQGTNPVNQQLEIWNDNVNATNQLDFTVTLSPVTWASLNSTSGSSTGEDDKTYIDVVLSTSSLQPTSVPRFTTITIDDDNSTSQQVIWVLLIVQESVLLEVDRSFFDIKIPEGRNAPSSSFTVINTGGGTSLYTIAGLPDWIKVSYSGSIEAAPDEDEVLLTFSTAGLSSRLGSGPRGIYTATLVVTPNDSSIASLSIEFVLDIAAWDLKSIFVDPLEITRLTVSGQPARESTIRLINIDSETYNYTITPSSSFIKPAVTSGTLTPQKEEKVVVSFDVNEAPGGRLQETITVTVPGTNIYEPGSVQASEFRASAVPVQTSVVIDLIFEVQRENLAIADLSVDHVGRLWSYCVGPSVMTGQASLFLKQIDTSDGTEVRSFVLAENLESLRGGLAVLSDGTFYITVKLGGVFILMKSVYPLLSAESIIFNFMSVTNSLSSNVVSLTRDENDNLFGLDEDNFLYLIDKDTGELTLLSSIQEDPYVPPFDLQTVNGIGYQISGETELVGSDGTYHVYLEFYDNIKLEGKPQVIVDSRTDVKAFIADLSPQDPYDTLFDPGSGIFLPAGESGSMVFNGSLFRPGYTNRSYPFGFDTNQTYFPRVFVIDPEGVIRESDTLVERSFSCNKCIRFSRNTIDTSSCSYSFIFENNTASSLVVNFRVAFYSDPDHQNPVTTFELNNDSSDLNSVLMNSTQATNAWGDSGLSLSSDESVLIQIYPDIGTSDSLFCGIPYYVRVLKQVDGADFEEIDTTFWIFNVVDDSIGSVFTGIRSAIIDEQLSIAYGKTDTIFYATKDSSTQIWETTDIGSLLGFDTQDKNVQDIQVFESDPGILYTHAINDDVTVLRFARFSNGVWLDSAIDDATSIDNSTISQLDGQPIISYRAIQQEGEITVLFAFIEFDDDLGREVWRTVPVITPTSQQGQNHLAIIDGSPAIAYYSGGKIYYTVQESSGWSIPIEVDTGTLISEPRLINVDELPTVVYMFRNPDQVKYTTFNGSSFSTQTVYDVSVGETLNGSLDADIIRRTPHIVFNTSNGFKMGTLVESEWIISQIKTTSVIDADITQVFGHPVVLSIEESVDPTKVIPGKSVFSIVESAYNSADIRAPGTSPEFICNCSSSIFEDAATNLNLVPRWQSSAHGKPDTRITDSFTDCMKPSTQVRSSDAAIILYEQYLSDDKERSAPEVRGALFRRAEQNRLFGSGSRSWFDYEFAINGRDVVLNIDAYDHVVAAFEVPHPVGSGKLPKNSVDVKICGFEEEETQPPSFSHEFIEFSLSESEEDTLIVSDPFISSKVIKKIRIKEMAYVTLNATGQVTPVVDKCNVILQIYGTPEAFAYRIRNENQTNFSEWCPWSPEIGNTFVEVKWLISEGSGIKEICVQIMTYSGITAQFCLPIIADLERVIIEIKLYTEVDNQLQSLPSLGILPIASTQFEVVANEIILLQTKEIIIEIIPNIVPDAGSIYFDVLHQGRNDIIRKETEFKGTLTDGREGFRGRFSIHVEDNIRYKDGLAKILVRIPSACATPEGSVTDIEPETMTSDRLSDFNFLGQPQEISLLPSENDLSTVTSDLDKHRQDISGRIGIDITVRPSKDDPYFVFGDPNYYFQKDDPKQTGSIPPVERK